MAFIKNNFDYLQWKKGWTMWFYKNCEDTAEEMAAENYFQEIAHLLKTGDVIYLVAKDTTKQMYFVVEDNNVKLQELGK